MPKIEGFTLANIARAEIVTEEAQPKTYIIETASEAGVEALVSEGNENELRVKNQILAQNIFEDIVKGYTVTLTDVVFAMELLALIDGGTYTAPAESVLAKYEGPVAGTVASRTKFTLNLYTEEKEYDGTSISSYMKFSFPHCIGSPAKFSLKDGEWISPEYTLKSRPGKGESPLTVQNLAELPAIA